jgi:NO-binding membrane sensor protein with MHYT domain
LAAILLSTTIQATHFCGLRGIDAQASVELNPASSGTPTCLICLMAPSISAILLLVAFFTMASSTIFVGGLQMRPKPVRYSLRLYIRPPPFGLA